MNKHITVNALDADSVQKAITALKEYDKEMNRKADIFVSKLASYGVKNAQARFDSAITTGSNRVGVWVDNNGDKWKAVVANGSSTLFIEFGTGIRNGAVAGDEPELYGMSHGGFGLGKAGDSKDGSWLYPANFGTGNAPNTYQVSKKYIRTFGIPGQAPMYYTVQDLTDICSNIAKEVFGE